MRTPSAPTLSPAQTRDLFCIAGIMIPSSEAFGVPGADDPQIFTDILASFGRDLPAVQNALTVLAASAGGSFADLPPARQEAVAAAFLNSNGDAATLGRVVMQCYYRDDRVVRSLGLEPGAPFPKGRKLEQGDWSLLDAVRNRPKLWRDAP